MSRSSKPTLQEWPKLFETALSQGDCFALGLRGSALSKLLADCRPALTRPVMVIAPDPEAAGDIHNDLCFYLAENARKAGISFSLEDAKTPHLWPAWDILPSETDSPDVETASDQVAILRACLSGQTAPWIVGSITSVLQATLPPEVLKAGGLRISQGMEIFPEALVAHLADGGLEATAQVDAPGQYSRRGGIVDVFPLLGDLPYRVEFFGDEVDSVRIFDPATQQNGPALENSVTLIDVSKDSFRLAANGAERYSLLDYLPEDALIVIRHPERVERVAELYVGGFSGEDGGLFTFAEAAKKLARFAAAVVPDLDSDFWPETPWREPRSLQTVDFGAGGWERLSGGFDTSLKELTLLIEKDVGLTIACNNAAEEKRLKQVLQEKNPAVLAKAELTIGRLSRGFIAEMPGGKAYVSDHELFGRQTPVRTSRKRYAGTPIADFAELREGDYVVHIANGIAKFEGIKTLENDGAEQDYLTLRFAEDARIYVPLSHIDLVQRYIGLGEARPQLTKLGSAAWQRKKSAVEKAVRDIAQDLLATQAKRLSSPGIALPPDDALVREFDASFPYDETPDQLNAIDDISRDQQSPSPMERLLCGDVGFGKTEMAVRAAFRAVNAGYQAAVLAPTTILAEQHYRTFSDRMADYPVSIECLSRFRSPNDQKRIVENVREGRTDVVIGTHRLLSDDVAFKNLGLVVIDEEQKFGVESKERLKRFRADVDILTMTATPIPRTLHMSLLGLRDISNLTTPPRDRHSVKTMVVRWSDEIIRRAILRELSRDGQCFFLHNRVHNIDEMAGRLQRLVPEARIAVGHGQMAEGELLQVMTRFLDGKIDVLVCTTIIESGVDIAKVNTLLVDEADHFGLSELHQLRGRVGRYRHQAYAYFLVPPKRPLSPEATKRLQALQDYSELGSGFRIAMRDLEIRGAGNLLGVEQSGHIHMIGFDLYCRLLEKAVASEKGEKIEDEPEAELDLGTRAFIPPEYIPSEQQRIEFYRRLTRVRSQADLEATRTYVRGRYGPPPGSVERCFADQALRIRMANLGITSLDRIDNVLAAGFADNTVKRAVMLLRHAGFKTTLLNKNKWRVEIPGVDNALEPGLYAVAMAEKLLSVLEDGELARPRRKEKKAKEKVQPEPAAAEADKASDAKPAAATRNQAAEIEPDAGDGHLAYFSTDMLDDPPQRQAKETPKPKSKSKGKSGAGASKPQPAKNKAQPALPGGAREKALMPQTASRPDILALGFPKQKEPATRREDVGTPQRQKIHDKKPPLSAKNRKPAPEPELEEEGDAKTVFGVEPHIAKGEIGVVVSDKAFPSPPFSAMTLVVGGETPERFFLRCTGSAKGAPQRMVLTLKTSGPEEAQKAAESYLSAGNAVLFAGIVEQPADS